MVSEAHDKRQMTDRNLEANRHEGKTDEPQINPPSSLVPETMAGRLQIYADRDGRLPAARGTSPTVAPLQYSSTPLLHPPFTSHFSLFTYPLRSPFPI